MQTPSDKNRNRGVFDVQKSEAETFFGRLHGRLRGGHVLNLRPKFRVRHPLAVFAAAAAAVLVLALGMRQFFTKAEVADFYPSACLGEWSRADLAQGIPESFGKEGSYPDETNSAVYLAAAPFSSSRIFCGSFSHTDAGWKEDGEIESVGLTLVWRVGEWSGNDGGASISPTDNGSLDNASSSGEAVQLRSPQVEAGVGDAEPAGGLDGNNSEAENVSEEAAPEENGEVSPPENSNSTTTNINSTTTTFFGRVLLAKFFSFAFAQESNPAVNQPNPPADAGQEAVAEPEETEATGEPPEDLSETPAQENVETISAEITPPAPASAAPAENEEETIITAPPIEAKLEPLSPSAADFGEGGHSISPSAASSGPSGSGDIASQVIDAPPAPDENFLKISYSVNGRDWFESAKINRDNWQSFTVVLPVKNWESLRNLQVRIEAIPTTAENVPDVYLDGMFAEVNYKISSAIIGGGADADGEKESEKKLRLEDAEEPFPDLPKVILRDGGAVDVRIEEWPAGEAPTIEIDI